MPETKWPDPKQLGSAPCGTAVSYSHPDGMTDEAGHPVAILHLAWADRMAAGYRTVKALHCLDLEPGFVPVCIECRKVYPCPTAVILGA